MFSNSGIFKKGIIGNSPVLSETGSPTASDFFIFDLGYDVDYDFQINIRIFNIHNTYKNKLKQSFGILFNHVMSFDLYNIFVSDRQYKSIFRTMSIGKEHFSKHPMCGIPFYHNSQDVLIGYMNTYMKDFDISFDYCYIYYYVNDRPTNQLKNIYYVHN